MILVGDCVERMAAMPEASINAIVTDPPYGIRFMGQAWDAPGIAAAVEAEEQRAGGTRGDHTKTSARSASMHAGRYDLSQSANQAFQAWCEAWAREALRVLKPGGHLLAFGGTRTYHRLAAGIEDAGFEIRDTIAWLYGSGSPKSLNVSAAIDKAAGAEREVVGRSSRAIGPSQERGHVGSSTFRESGWEDGNMVTAPATPEAERWQGWGTALKPAFEPIVVARKPLAGTVAASVLAHGCGALNVDGCRIDTGDEIISTPQSDPSKRVGIVGGAWQASSNAERNAEAQRASVDRTNTLGRWPANVVLDQDAAEQLDQQTGESVSTGGQASLGAFRNGDIYGAGRDEREKRDPGYGDKGGASRFFYTAKASSAERNAGLDGFEAGERQAYGSIRSNRGGGYEEASTGRNSHPTVKPIDLMRWLVRLITPPAGTVLDPFAGSGTTGIAATLEGFEFVGIERDPDYARIADARIAWWAAQPAGITVDDALAGDSLRRAVSAGGQLDLLGGAA